MNKFCKKHEVDYYYICPECVKPFLGKTHFSSLEEVRKYQLRNAKRVNKKDISDRIRLIGIIKLRILNEIAFVGILIYDIDNHIIIDSLFKTFKPRFSQYFPSILFLNQTEIYLSIIKAVKTSPHCYLINVSGQIHPYLFGTACDVGIQTKTPVIGYTKKLLYGRIDAYENNHSFSGVYHNNTLIGYAIPRENSTKCLYISVGNNISLQRALNVFLKIDSKILSKLNNALKNFKQSVHNKSRSR